MPRSSRPSAGSTAPMIRRVSTWRGRPVAPDQDLADFRQGVEIRVKAMFVTPESRVKAQWGVLRLSAEPDATWTAKVGRDTLTIPRATTTIALAEKQNFKRVPRFELTLADGSVRTMAVTLVDAELVRAAFGASAA